MAINLQYITAIANTTSQSTHDLGNVTMPWDGLLIVVPVLTYPSAQSAISSVSLDGGTASIVSTANSSNLRVGAIACREVAAGNRNVTINLPAASNRLHVAVFGIQVGTYKSATPLSHHSFNTTTATSLVSTLNYGAAGVAIFVSWTSGGLISWANASAHLNSTATAIRILVASRAASGADVAETLTLSGPSFALMLSAAWEEQTFRTWFTGRRRRRLGANQ